MRSLLQKNDQEHKEDERGTEERFKGGIVRNMRHVFVTGESLPDAYHNALLSLYKYGEHADCADWDTTQKEVSMTMRVNHPLSEPRISKLFIGGPKELEQYRMEMLDGILDFEVEKGNWVYTYHDRMTNYYIDNVIHSPQEHSFNQIDFVIKELRRNPSSRRAVILIRDNSDDVFEDSPACLQHLQFFIRNGQLDCYVLFRSNDACKATFMNAFALICLQERIANELGIPVGYYNHTANSFHCYEKDFDLLRGYAKRIEETKDLEDICFDYEDDWREEMDAARPEIMEQVDILKDR